MYSEDYEEILEAAGRIDDRLSDSWCECVGDKEYQTLQNFFSKDNFLDTWTDEYFDAEVVTKNLKRHLTGQDRIELIRYAFMLGRLVGKAEQILLQDGES